MTPAVTAAKRAGISYRLHSYTHDPAATSWSKEAARALKQPPERIFKTLVVAMDSGELVVALVPASATLNLKLTARAAGSRKAEMAPPAEVERITGYLLGGVSPLGQKKRLPLLMDESATTHETIFVSAGRRGLELELAPADLQRLTGATTAPLT